MSLVIDLDAKRTTTTLDVTGVGSVVVHSARGVAGLEMTLKAAVRTSAVLVADDLLVLSTDLTRARVRELLPSARRRLALAVARGNGWQSEWQALYGSYLDADERLVASAVWGHRRQWRELRVRLRSARGLQMPLGQPPNIVQRIALPASMRAALGAPVTIPATVHAALGIHDIFRRVSGILPASGFRLSASAVALGRDHTPGLASLAEAAPAAKLGLAGVGLERLRLVAGGTAGIRGQNASAKALADIGARTRLPDTVGRALGVQKAFASSLVLPELGKQLQTTFGIGRIQAQVDHILAPYRDVTRLQRLLSPLGAIGEELAALGRFLDTWDGDPLWFLLAPMGTRGTWKLVNLSRAQVEEALLRALEDVVLDGGYVAALRQAVAQTDVLTEVEQDHLDHALEHAQRAEWRHALSSFHPGFEGALYQAGLRHELVAPERGKKIVAAERLVKHVIGDGDYFLFVVHRVYGGVGNAHRHGRAPTGEREVMLSGIVALAGWIDHFLNLPAMEVLVGEVEDRLAAAIDGVTAPAQIERVDLNEFNDAPADRPTR